MWTHWAKRPSIHCLRESLLHRCHSRLKCRIQARLRKKKANSATFTPRNTEQRRKQKQQSPPVGLVTQQWSQTHSRIESSQARGQPTWPALGEPTPQGPTGRPHFIAVCFTVLRRYWIFCKLKVCGNPAPSKSIVTIFPSSICSLTTFW